MNPTPLYFVWNYNDVDRAFWAEHLEDWLPRRLLDAHTHVANPAHRLVPMTDVMRRQYWVNELFEAIDAPAAERCYRTVFPNRDLSCVAFGMPDREICTDFPIWDLLTKNLTLIGSEGPDPIPNYSLARDMIAQGRIDVSPIISHVLPFQEIQKAYDLFVNREDGAIKVVLDYDTLRA